VEGPAEDPVGGGAEGDWEMKGGGRSGTSWPMRGIAGRCWTPSSTDVGRRGPAEEDAVSEVSEAELREWEEGRAPEELGAGVESPLFLPTPDFMAATGEG